MLRNSKGFTLVELIIVIVIIGILAAVAIPKFNELSDSAKIAACKQNEAIIETGATSYYGQQAIANNGQGAYPVDQAAMVPDFLDAVITCPVDGVSGYTISAVNGGVDCVGGPHV